MKRIDCDVFMKDGSILDMDKVIAITGNFYAGKHCCVSTAIIAGESVILEDYADTVCICAGGKVRIGNFSSTMSISSDQSISLGDYTYANDLFAKKDVFLGYRAGAFSISCDGDIFLNQHCTLKTFFIQLFLSIRHRLFGE